MFILCICNFAKELISSQDKAALKVFPISLKKTPAHCPSVPKKMMKIIKNGKTTVFENVKCQYIHIPKIHMEIFSVIYKLFAICTRVLIWIFSRLALCHGTF